MNISRRLYTPRELGRIGWVSPDEHDIPAGYDILDRYHSSLLYADTSRCILFRVLCIPLVLDLRATPARGQGIWTAVLPKRRRGEGVWGSG